MTLQVFKMTRIETTETTFTLRLSLHANRSLASFVLPLSHLQVDVDSPPNSIPLFI